MVFAFAISQLCAGNPALPQSVPLSVLLNFFMTASESSCDADAGETACVTFEAQAKGVPGIALCNVITLHLSWQSTCGRRQAENF